MHVFICVNKGVGREGQGVKRGQILLQYFLPKNSVFATEVRKRT
jgi:hypothetical protein